MATHSADKSWDDSSDGNPAAILRIREEFEYELQRAGKARIEEFLHRASAGDRRQLLQHLIEVWVVWQLGQGHEPQLAELVARFPDRQDAVKEAFMEGTEAFQAKKREKEKPELPSTILGHPERPSQKQIPVSSNELPGFIGPYAVKGHLGSGKFGDVYRAWDPKNSRFVALKCIRFKQNQEPTETQRQMFLEEWRKLEGLNHEGIVRVYGVMSHEGCPVIVQELVQGGTLRDLLKRSDGRLSPEQAVSLTIDICKALVHLHSRKIYHRDLKPDNMMLDQTGRVKLMDFGLALHRSDRASTAYQAAGSLAYMAPEQIEGKTHRQDGRCDLWAVGVILYEMIIGERPFHESSQADLKRAILHGAATPPHQLDSSIPRALGEICCSCLERNLRNRYSSALDVLADLEACLKTVPLRQSPSLPSSGTVKVTASSSCPASGSDPASNLGPGSGSGSGTNSPTSEIIGPKEFLPPTFELRGLRSYSEDDAEIFLQLLPGKRAPDGLPIEVSAFRRKLEQSESGRTFPVGLIHGPSGCGKTSLMRAGIQPRLAAHVTPVYLECSGDGTEARLREEFQRVFPNLPADLQLSELVQRLVDGEWLPAGRKILVILDQFEQWLYRRAADSRTELGDALAASDGGRVQCVLMIRDDFWSGLERLLQRADLPPMDDNYRLFVDVFDRQHGERVLTLLGQGAGCLPQQLTIEGQGFVREAVQQLAGAGGTVDSARLSLLAFMLRRQQWTIKTLHSLGGLDGLGERFLRQSFTDAGANPIHRRYQSAARAVLSELLPQEGRDIRAQRISCTNLEEIVQRVDRHADPGLILRILDRELRLITPAQLDPTASSTVPAEISDSAKQATGYQLTHDYLVPSLRNWINSDRERTPAGRAELMLERRERLYRVKRERRQLPSLKEWARIRWHVPQNRWTVPQQQMMSAAGVWHFVQSVIAGTVLLIFILTGLLLHTNTLVENLEHLEIAGLLDASETMQPVRFIARPLLERKQRNALATNDSNLAAKALLSRLPLGPIQLSKEERELLLNTVATAQPADLAYLSSLLQHAGSDMVQNLIVLCTGSGNPRWARNNAACVLARLTTDRAAPWCGNTRNIVMFVFNNLFEIARKDPVAITHFEQMLRYQSANWMYRMIDHIAATPVAERFEPCMWTLLTASDNVRKRAVSDLTTQLDRSFLTPRSYAAIAASILKLQPEKLPLKILTHSADPSVRNLFLHRISRFDVPATALVQRLESLSAGELTDPSICRALIQGLGEVAHQEDEYERSLLLHKLEPWRNHRDPGVHSTAVWAMGKMWHNAEFTHGSPDWKIDDGPFWELRNFGRVQMEFAIIDGRSQAPIIRLSENVQRPSIGHIYAIGMREVTNEEYGASLDYVAYLRFVKQLSYYIFPTPHDELFYRQIGGYVNEKYGRKPAIVTWHQAALYCNWLSEREGLDLSQWCYEPDGTPAGRVRLKENWRELAGYRLPTEAEWEYACRAGTVTEYSFGDLDEYSKSLLGDYACYASNSESVEPLNVGSKIPNGFGLFDMHGNACEWCQDEHDRDADGNSPWVDEMLTGNLYKVLRGGAYSDTKHSLGSSSRTFDLPISSRKNSGFRVVRTYKLMPDNSGPSNRAPRDDTAP